MIAVMGATGHTGKRIAELLLQSGERVRALGRSTTKLADLERQGADVRTGDAANSSYLTEAFRGAEAAYVLLPPDMQASDYRASQARVAETITTALRDSGVRTIVVLSSVGAERVDGTGPIVTLHDFEARLRTLPDADILILRAAYFFENFGESLDLIRGQGIHANAIDPDVPIPMIATRDIADVAASALRARDWRGIAIRELLGPRDLTMTEATRVLGACLGKPDLPYHRMSYEDLTDAFVEQGLSEDVARAYVELCRALNDGTVRSLEERSPSNTTPTRFEDFAIDLVRRAEVSPLGR